MSKMSQSEFLQRSIAIHGDEYDYSLVEFKGTKTPVNIICKKHGIFSQRPEKHLIGRGCPECGKTRYEETNLKKYGVRRPLQNEAIKKKMQQTNLEKYGTECCLASDVVKEKKKQTCLEKYGVEYSLQSPEIRAKIASTNQERYGGDSPFSSRDIQKKSQVSIMDRYGVDNVSKNIELRQKQKDTCLEKYGCESPLASDEIRAKIYETNLERYGEKSVLANVDIRKKGVQTLIDKYNVSNCMKVPEFVDKVRESKSENHTFNTSSSEEIMYESLCELFGKDDVQRQYSSEKYPFACDFYIVSMDLYIELNGTWTHNNHWYSGSKEDEEIVSLWKSKNTVYYTNAVENWTKHDVLKRETAIANNLNYLVFWNSDLTDFKLWVEMGCPLGNDAIEEYSWMGV